MVRSVAKVVADPLMLCTARQSSTVTLPGRRMVRQSTHKVDLPGPVPSGAAKSRVGGVKRGGSPATAPLLFNPEGEGWTWSTAAVPQSHHQLPNRGQYCMHDIAPGCPFLTAEHEMVGLHAIFTPQERSVKFG
ncbi:hypothetical protein QR685DRAFT_576220 [Neurospora intermedia]|uniref:Uncharacterized protein n=1 Tax=Neurospora intermedia TaxID=5142 RepID=A0ABR3CY70_NEUIN